MKDSETFKRTADGGLDAGQVAARLARDGYNEQSAGTRRGWPAIALEVVREPLFALLLAAALLYLLLGERSEALMLLGFALITIGIAIVQQGRSERVLDALRRLASPRARVIRAGEQREIPAREVVADDLLLLAEGDRIVADGRLVAGDALLIDESALTGESVPVLRSPADLQPVYAGTLVQRGTARAQVTATGVRSELGRIGQWLGEIRTSTPRLQRETRGWVLWFAAGGVGVSLLATLTYGFMRGDWLQALLAGIALSMSMLPEEIPLVLTVFTVMGAWRLSRSQVLTRRAAVIETLGAATVLCTDKTGTLTRNRMQLAELRADGQRWRMAPAPAGDAAASLRRGTPLGELLAGAAAASEAAALDPMDRSVHELARQAEHEPGSDAHLLRHYPLQPELPVAAQLWRRAAPRRTRLLAVKGAPEAIAHLCRLDAAARAALLAQVDEMARDGLRVLAVAGAELDEGDDHVELHDGHGFELSGLLGFVDPLHESVPAAMRECRSAGIRVLLVTGDYPLTAQAIARQAGIESDRVLTGAALSALDEDGLRDCVRTHQVFARITPGQKLRIVQALQANGEVVAMTGDGVNDAPALRAADIGIAMGRRGTEVAREAAALVLLDDNFGTIVGAVRMGRRIYDNLRKAMAYILALHVPIAGLALLPIVLGAPLVLTPVMIALLEMIIDPTCSIALEAQPAEPDVMRRPPRPRAARMLDWPLVLRAVAQGALAFALVAGVYLLARQQSADPDVVRAMGFIAVVSAILALLASQRAFGSAFVGSRRQHNDVLWLMLLVAALLIVALALLAPLQQLLRMGALSAGQLAESLGAGVLLLLLLEAGKRLRRRRPARA